MILTGSCTTVKLHDSHDMSPITTVNHFDFHTPPLGRRSLNLGSPPGEIPPRSVGGVVISGGGGHDNSSLKDSRRWP